MKILLTGEPGVGKSTLLSLVIDAFEQKQGFITTEVRTNGIRTSFNMTASNGESFELSSVGSPSDIRVSRYGVNLEELNLFIRKLPSIDADKLIYVDEIGQMQLYSDSYKKLINDYINLPNPFIGTISKIYNDAFTDELRKRNDIEVIKVTLDNRDVLKDELISRIAKYIHWLELSIYKYHILWYFIFMTQFNAPRILAEGRLDWPKQERLTDRYGVVNIQTAGRHPVESERELIERLLARAQASTGKGSITQAEEDPTAEHATFRDAPVGTIGQLLVRVLVTRGSYHAGDADRKIKPTTPDVNEVIILGEGELFVEMTGYNDAFINSIGVRPEGDRETDWMDPYALYRAHDQTVELSFKPRLS